VDQLGVKEFTPYVMDFGGAIGYGLALAHPDRLMALVMQNAPLYPQAPKGWWATLGRYWQDGSAQHRDESREYLTAESTRDQYLYGVEDPDGTVIAAAFTHADLAHMVGATRQWVTISLKRMQEKRIVLTKRSQIVVCLPNVLEEMRGQASD